MPLATLSGENRRYRRLVTSPVVALGAWCDYVPEEEALASPGSISFDVEEFAVLNDGRRVTLHSGELGFSVSGPRSSHPLADMSAADIRSAVLTTVLADDDDTGDEHPYGSLAGLLRQHEVVVSADSLRSVPYKVEFSERLQQLLATRQDDSMT